MKHSKLLTSQVTIMKMTMFLFQKMHLLPGLICLATVLAIPQQPVGSALDSLEVDAR